MSVADGRDISVRPSPGASGASGASGAPRVRFAGYAAVFDRIDRGGDIVRAGAFAGLSRPVPLLWQHRGDAVGTIDQIAEDAQGLRVIGTVEAPELASLVSGGGVKGLSFGYRVKAARQLSTGRGRVRELLALDLIEVSLVVAPMQPLARVHAVESG